MHCHPNKKTSLIVLSGEVHCSTLEGWLGRKVGEGLVIDEAVFHSTKAVSREGALVMEIESPPNKKELVRLNDEYGREHQGYEGPAQMTRKKKGYDYIDFHGSGSQKKITKRLKNIELTLRNEKSSDDIHVAISGEQGKIFCLLQGRLHDQNGTVILATGEAARLSDLKSISRLYAFGDIIYLTLSPYGKKS